jgi:threonylcarbamoyladenosine tRNA methylthiotransferase MtaB
MLLENTSKIALRLSSIEPDFITEKFAEAVSDKRVRPYFHLSVQSLSGPVLKNMRRTYGPERVLEAVDLLRRVKDDPFLGCDMITGFPGETDEDAEETYRNSVKARFSWMHVFPFSSRPGTPAALMRPKVSQRVSGERAERLGILARQGREAYTERWKGREVDAVVERFDGKLYTLLSGNYLKWCCPASALGSQHPAKRGSAVKVLFLP